MDGYIVIVLLASTNKPTMREDVLKPSAIDWKLRLISGHTPIP